VPILTLDNNLVVPNSGVDTTSETLLIAVLLDRSREVLGVRVAEDLVAVDVGVVLHLLQYLVGFLLLFFVHDLKLLLANFLVVGLEV
jgi:hypothetical protein